LLGRTLQTSLAKGPSEKKPVPVAASPPFSAGILPPVYQSRPPTVGFSTPPVGSGFGSNRDLGQVNRYRCSKRIIFFPFFPPRQIYSATDKCHAVFLCNSNLLTANCCKLVVVYVDAACDLRPRSYAGRYGHRPDGASRWPGRICVVSISRCRCHFDSQEKLFYFYHHPICSLQR
jgi:hypothetical protein